MESLEPIVHLSVDTVIMVMHVSRLWDTAQPTVTLDGNGRIVFAIQVNGAFIHIFKISINWFGCKEIEKRQTGTLDDDILNNLVLSNCKLLLQNNMFCQIMNNKNILHNTCIHFSNYT